MDCNSLKAEILPDNKLKITKKGELEEDLSIKLIEFDKNIMVNAMHRGPYEASEKLTSNEIEEIKLRNGFRVKIGDKFYFFKEESPNNFRCEELREGPSQTGISEVVFLKDPVSHYIIKLVVSPFIDKKTTIFIFVNNERIEIKRDLYFYTRELLRLPENKISIDVLIRQDDRSKKYNVIFPKVLIDDKTPLIISELKQYTTENQELKSPENPKTNNITNSQVRDSKPQNSIYIGSEKSYLQEVVLLRNENEKLKGDLKSCKEENSQLKNQKNNLDAKIENLNKENDTLKKLISESKLNFKKNEEDYEFRIQGLNKRINELNKYEQMKDLVEYIVDFIETLKAQENAQKYETTLENHSVERFHLAWYELNKEFTDNKENKEWLFNKLAMESEDVFCAMIDFQDSIEKLNNELIEKIKSGEITEISNILNFPDENKRNKLIEDAGNLYKDIWDMKIEFYRINEDNWSILLNTLNNLRIISGK